MAQETPTRRVVVPGIVVTVAGAGAGFAVASTSSAADPKPPTAAANGGGDAPGGEDGPLVQLSDVPPDGGVVLSDAGIVLTRDSGDGIQGFSAVCTHQGCLVSSVAQGQINCPCHGSSFDARTGEPVAGPARTKLPPVAVTVRDNAVFRA
ncbi:twin-arginine translocation pathway signal protein [Parafrankia colletiae]|uniref:Cytochrome bc1 complex Rieske iron-sulfur subunit n=1 Tax=Parafrankia colletiae TaxID=573497 RepID=A0A1S1QBX7_9ACTN|nr:Rieske (2Fe-2S) protein [Parafrankia colletiae]MCK9902547.1 Rieske (2Fe-2S) protein [Frankia sp. Cpl3]OHV31470.1 twin-arginine translocation pathway signal protein [Parafrankia colletiae]